MRALLETMPDLAERRWQTWRRKQRLEATSPEHFAELLAECLAYAEPVLDHWAAGATWDPRSRAWESPDRAAPGGAAVFSRGGATQQPPR